MSYIIGIDVGGINCLAKRLFKAITDIQFGKVEDVLG